MSERQNPYPQVRILYITRDDYPTFRVDINVLFGRYLAEMGVDTTIVARHNPDEAINPGLALKTKLYVNSTKSRYSLALKVWLFNVITILRYGREYDIIQVRNKIVLAVLGLLVAKIYRRKFVYWMSFPYPEDDLIRVKEHGRDLGLLRSSATYIRGIATRFILYRVVLSRADHVFVQSKKMHEDVLKMSKVLKRNVTIVPMAVDNQALTDWIPQQVTMPSDLCIAYLGAMDRARRIDFLFEAMTEIVKHHPDAVLLLIGDCIEANDWAWLEKKATELGILESITKTGWVERDTAWS
ncbi:MAG: glycosyltransferase, partial [Pseudomonadota bacterium]